MSKIRLHGSSSGYTEIAPVAASGNNTLTLPNDGTIISKDSNGAVGVTSITVGTGVTIGDGKITCDGSALTSINAAQLVGVCTSGLTKTGGFGKILQVVSSTKTDTASTSSGTPANISGLTPTITTTETNSKVLVMMDVKLSCGNYGDHVGLNLYRSITGGSAGEIYRGDADGSRGRYSFGAEDMFGNNGDHQVKQISSTFVDSPSQAAGTEIVYSIQWNHLSGTAIYLNRDGDNSNDARSPRMASSLTLIEIAA